MLPDYPETKALFSAFLQTRMRRLARALSPLGTIDARHIHEGQKLHVSRADDSVSTSKAETLSALSSITFEEVRGLTFEKSIEHHDNLVREMVAKQAGFFAERIAADIPETQTVQAAGRALTAELLIEVFERMEMEFNPDGTPQALHVMGDLFTHEKLREIENEVLASEELSARFQNLIQKKKDAWRDREASRKLVG